MGKNFRWKSRLLSAAVGAGLSRVFRKGGSKAKPGVRVGLKSRRPMGRVMTKKKKLHQRAVLQGAGGSFSKFFYGKRKWPWGIPKGIAKNFYQSNSAGRITQTAGLQAVWDAFTIYSPSIIQTIGAINSANHANRNVHLSASSELMLTNQDQANVRIAIYDIVARRDNSSASTVDGPTDAFKNGLADQGGSASSYQVVGTTPFASSEFTSYFKVLKITHVILGAGQTHSHRIHFQPNKVVNTEVGYNSTKQIKGLTCTVMVVATGEPANDATTKTSVSTGQIAIDAVAKTQYKYSYLSDPTNTFTSVNNLSTFAVSEEIMSVATGATIANETPA